MSEYLRVVSNTIETKSNRLHQIGRYLWENPETKYEEYKAHDYITDFLEAEGFPVQRNYILPTAFRAEFGGDGPVVVIMCEYDALPEIGHACGHNLIAECAVAAALAVKKALEENGSLSGKVILLGTPAEEGGMGKVKLLKSGAFDNVDVAVMAHPCNVSCTGGTNSLVALEVNFKGKASHAGAAPWDGKNALDAAVAAYVNVSVLRQQMKPSWRVAGIIKDGGTKASVIPATAKMEFILRAPDEEQLNQISERVRSCLHSAAQATGCSVDVTTIAAVKNLVPNRNLTNIYESFAETFGAQFTDPSLSGIAGASTDAGDVSHAVPTIHPMFALSTTAALHSADFQKAAGTQDALDRALTTGKSLALTCLQVMRDRRVLQKIKDEFNATRATF